MSLKVDSFLRTFKGSGEDFERFWEKFEVLAEIQTWNDEAKLMKNFPLFLEENAFLVFSRKDAADRKKQDKVLAKLRQSFCMTKAQAYSAFTKRKLRIDESP
eukprot:scpid113988/ scgid22327/ 